MLEQRLYRAPSLSVNQLKNKIFGRFESDEEFRLVMHAAAPLYSESFDADAALSTTLKTVYYAESHSKSSADAEGPSSQEQMICTQTKRNILIIAKI